MQTARLLVDSPAAGSWNMAVDQVLLESVSRTGSIVLRFYRWDRPTLSLGYFQALQDRDLHLASRNCPIVRRSTGGGAILHDREITYSLCIPSSERWSRSHERLYWVIHGAIIDTLSAWGIRAETHGTLRDADQNSPVGCGGAVVQSQEPKKSDAVELPFLCFQRRSPGDIVLQGFKICGSAQRRQQDSLLQHGSMLFRRSVFAPELPGILDLVDPVGADRELEAGFIEACGRRVAGVLDLNWSPSTLSAAELEQAAVIEQKFLSAAWTDKRRRNMS